jgi:hypothetical protein
MKKTQLIRFFTMLITAVVYTASLPAQEFCTLPLAQSDLGVNNVRARLKNAGDLWWDGNEARYIVPNLGPGQAEVAAIFAGSLWIGGYDEQGNLKLAAPTYGADSNQSDYFAGPLDEQGQTDIFQCDRFDQIWSTTSANIDTFLQDWNDNGVLDNPVPSSLLKWPGRGNPHSFSQNGFSLPNQALAPFFDQNNDGIYDPLDGDYPDIRDADEGHWMVFNDKGNAHTDSGGEPLGVEIHLLAYAYKSTDEAINNATFYEYTLLNKSGGRLDSVFAALWVDADLGCPSDDYIGCSPQRNLAYAYNRDAVDGSSGCSCQGVNTYCEDIPLIGIKLLDGALAGRNFGPGGTLVTPPVGQTPDTTLRLGMTSFMHYRSGSVSPTPPSVLRDPQTPQEYYRLMTGHWRDGTPLTSGGSGYNPQSTDYVSFSFPGNPSDGAGWSMCAANTPTIDPRMVISSGPFRMEAGEANSLSFAVIFQAGAPHPCPDVSGLEAIADEVHFFYDGTVFTAADEPLSAKRGPLEIVPNLFSQQASVKLPATVKGEVWMEIFTAQGQRVRKERHVPRNGEIPIDRGALNPGVYFCRVMDGTRKVYNGRFVIQ